MNRQDFERPRDAEPKIIRVDLRLISKPHHAPELWLGNVSVENPPGLDVRLNMQFNPETGKKIFNIVTGGIAVCRLCVDNKPHGNAGRSHKHAFRGQGCVSSNLGDDVVAKPELSGVPMRAAFEAFCAMSHLVHVGQFFAPDEAEGGAA